jgi:hypothetical protein
MIHIKKITGPDWHGGAHTCNPSYLGGRGRRITSPMLAQTKLARSYLKNKTNRNACGYIAQIVDLLPSMCKALV